MAMRALQGSSPRMAARVGAIVLTLAATGCATAPQSASQAAPEADLPPALQHTQDEAFDSALHAQGDMRFVCSRMNTDTTASPSAAFAAYTWKPVGTLARLFDDTGRAVALVTPEGYYSAYDGSYAVARVTDTVQPDPPTLPWTRETIRFAAMSPAGDGRFANTAAIVRAHTIGGLAPTQACDQEGTSLAVPFFATYLLYRHAGERTGMTTSHAIPLNIETPISVTAP